MAGVSTLEVSGPAQAFPGHRDEEVLPWLDQPAPNPVPAVLQNLLVWEELDSWLTPADDFMARDYVTIREQTRDGRTVWTFNTVSHDRLKSAPAKVTRRRNRYRIIGAAWGAPIAEVVDGRRRRAYALTEEGRRALVADAERMRDAADVVVRRAAGRPARVAGA